MKTTIESSWDALEEARQKDTNNLKDLLLKNISPQANHSCFAGIDTDGRPLIAFEVSMKPPHFDADTASISSTRVRRSDGNWLILLCLKRTGLEQVFGKLCQDLADEASALLTETAIFSLLKQRLTLWRKLFQNSEAGMLQPHEIKGLVGELLTLKRLLEDSGNSKHQAVVAWTGPSGADHDFTLIGRSIEVKSASSMAHEVTISSAHQLYCNQHLFLHVYLLKDCAPGEIGSFSPLSLVSEIEDLLQEDPDALTELKKKLLSANFVPNDYYAQFCYHVFDFKSYRVIDGFPRITPDQLSAGISRVSYSISLSSISEFIAS